MAVAGALLTQGSSTTDAASYTTASITPTANALVLVGVMHRVTTAPALPISDVVGNSLNFFPVATVLMDQQSSGRFRRLSVWAGMAAVPTTSTIVIGTGAALGALWGVIEFTGVDTSSETPNIEAFPAIRQISLAEASNAGAPFTSRTAYLGARRGAGAAVCGFFAHGVNEATTPGTGLTELVDQANADVGGLEASWSATYRARLSASWATGTALCAGIGFEIAAPSDTLYRTDPVGDLYA